MSLYTSNYTNSITSADKLALHSSRNSAKFENTSLSADSFNPKDLNTSKGLLMDMLFAE